MKKLLPILLFVLVLSFTVYADISLAPVLVAPSSGVYPGETFTLTVLVTNVDAAAPTTVAITTADATEVGGNVINLRDGNLIPDGTIGAGATRSFDITLDSVPLTVLGTYTATLTVQEDKNGNGIIDPEDETITQNYNFVLLNPLVVSVGGQAVAGSLTIDLETGEDENLLVVTLANRGNIPLNNIRVSNVFTDPVEDNDGDTIIISPLLATIATIGADASLSVTFNYDVERGFDVSQEDGILRIQTDQDAAMRRSTDTTFVLSVKPLACLPGSRSRDFEIDIESPDNNDDFETGDIVNVEIDVENNGDDDIDTKLEAVLYNNDGDERSDSKSVSKNIDEGDRETFRFDLEIDTSDEDDEDFTLFVKVFDDDDDLSCAMDDVDLDVETPDHKITISNPTLSPSVANCGERVSGSALLRNTGDNDENVVFEVLNTQLRISQSSPSFSLESSSNENEQAVNFAFNAPQDAADGTYQLLFRARYSGEETINAVPLTIQNCGTASTPRPSQSTLDGNIVSTSGESPEFTGSSVFTEKSLFDKFNTKGSGIPLSVWILIDVLLVVLILGALFWLFRPR